MRTRISRTFGLASSSRARFEVGASGSYMLQARVAHLDARTGVYNIVHMAETVRIEPAAHAALAAIAKAKRIPLTEALTRAVEIYRREVFLEAVSAGYAALRADPKAWAKELDERGAWESTDADGLGDE